VKKINIAVVGLGYIAQVCHLPFLKKNRSVKIIALVDKNKNLLNKISSQYNVDTTYVDYKKLNKHKIDAVVICLNKFLNFEVSKYFLAKKISVFCEKPIAINYNNALTLKNLAIKNNKTLVVGYMKRHDYGTKFVLDYIKKKKKKLGKLLNINYKSLMGNSFPIKYNYIKYKKPFINVSIDNLIKRTVKHENKKKYINFLNTHSHGINLLRYYFDNNKRVFIHKRNLKENNIILKFKDKFIKFEYNFNKVNKWNEKLIFYFSKAKIVQTFGAPILKNKSSTININYYDNNKNKIFFNRKWAFETQTNAFIKSIKSNKRNVSDIKYCVEDLRIIEKIFSK